MIQSVMSNMSENHYLYRKEAIHYAITDCSITPCFQLQALFCHFCGVTPRHFKYTPFRQNTFDFNSVFTHWLENDFSKQRYMYITLNATSSGQDRFIRKHQCAELLSSPERKAQR